MALWLTTAASAIGQQEAMPGMAPTAVDYGAAPTCDYGHVSFFSQDLGTVLRLGYSTESYGQNQHGNFDVGTMQVLTFDDWIAFADGQVTMNDVQGVGFNIGTGIRWLTYPEFSADTGRVDGVSIWADGTSTEAGHFFPQFGISYESLGETWDFRANGYTPLGPQDKVGDFVSTDAIAFQGNSLSQVTEAVVDSSFYLAEFEAARRIGPDRDAWAFAGPYYLKNEDDDSAGYRVGVRGYAYPDLLLQFAVSDDEIFNTHATFSVVWFVGRTRTDYQPACGVPDRFRERVMRNDYVVLAQGTATSGIPLTNTDGSDLRFVHVDSSAAPGGNGTSENPFTMLDQINAGSQAGDIILAHAGSTFVGNGPTILKDNQRLLGEGGGVEFTVATSEMGTLVIPETTPGARNATRPMIVAALGDAIALANGNEVANFDIDGGDSAIIGENLTGNANLHDLNVTNGGNFGIQLTNIATTSNITLNRYTYDGGAGPAGGIQMNNFDGIFNASNSTFRNGTRAGASIMGDSDGTMTFASTTSFTNIAGTAFEINGSDGGVDRLGGTILVNSAITNTAGRSVTVQNLATGANIDFTGNISDGGTGILVDNNSGGTTTFATGTVEIEVSSGAAITVTDNAVAATTEFTGPLILRGLGAADGFVARNGGTLRVPNTGNQVRTDTGSMVAISGTTIANEGVNFGKATKLTASADAAIELRNNLNGPILVGVPGEEAGISGTIEAGAAAPVVIDNSANVTISGLAINNNSAVSGVFVRKTTTGTQTVNLNNLDINDGTMGMEVVGNGTGTLNLTVNDTTIDDPTQFGLFVDNIDSGLIDVNNTTIDGDPANAGAIGVRIQGSNANFNFDDNAALPTRMLIQNFSGTDFSVDGGTGTINYSGRIVNSTTQNPGDTSGRSVDIRNRSGGNVNFTPTSQITDDNQGIQVHQNSGGSVNFQAAAGAYTLSTDSDDALLVNDNTGGMFSFNGFNINTTSGTGVGVAGNADTTQINFSSLVVNATTSGNAFVAAGGGILSATGAANTLRTSTGQALQIYNMTIGASGVAFNSVNVTNGSSNAIRLADLAGGQVAIGPTSGAANAGGVLSTAGDVILLTNVANVDLRRLDLTSSGGNGVVILHNSVDTGMDVTMDFLEIDASALAQAMNVLANSTEDFALRVDNSDMNDEVFMAAQGSGHFGLLFEDSTIESSGTDIAFDLRLTGNLDGANAADILIRRNSDISAANASAFRFISDGATLKTVDFELDLNMFANTSPDTTVIIVAAGGTTLNSTITANTFTNSNAAGEQFFIRTNDATSNINLNLAGNTAGDFYLREFPGSDFQLDERDATLAGTRNTGNVIAQPTEGDFIENPGDVQRPTAP